MKLIYHGTHFPGSTTLQRFEAFAALPGVTAIASDSGARIGQRLSLYRRVRWKLRWPVDAFDENRLLIAKTRDERPEAIVVDASRVITRSTLKRLRQLGVKCLSYYTPDDIIGAHNLSWPLRLSFPEWDVFFTTKTFCVPELAARGVRWPYLIGNAYDRGLHRPLSREEIGEEYENFDCVFIGAYEAERCASINRLAKAGLSVVVYGGTVAGWRPKQLHSKVTLRDAQFAEHYTRALHSGRIALCFLRKLNRDRITTRTMETAAAARPMLAEKTDEHDQHFHDGTEYSGFESDDALVRKAEDLARDPVRRVAMGVAARARCLRSGYSTSHRAVEMMRAIANVSQRR